MQIYGPTRDFYIRNYFIWEKFVAPFTLVNAKIFYYFYSHKTVKTKQNNASCKYISFTNSLNTSINTSLIS